MDSSRPNPLPPPTSGQQWDIEQATAARDSFLGSNVSITHNYGLPAPATAPIGPAFQVPYPPNPLFTGRDAALARLHAELQACAPVAVAGMGGLGKTQLAVEYAHSQRATYPGGIFWLSMALPEDVLAQVAACAGPGGLALPNEAALTFEQKIAAVQLAWREPVARLLVFDNCEDPALLARWRSPIGCHLLLTTRRQMWPAHTGVQVLPLAELERAASIHLLLAPRATTRGTPVDALLAEPSGGQISGSAQSAADAICEALGDLPLALGLAGAYLEALPRLPLASYLARLREKELSDPSLYPTDLPDLPTGHERNVAAAFGLSYDRLVPRNPVDMLARTIFHRAGHLAPAPIPRRLVLRAVGLDPDSETVELAAGPAVARLVALGLIEELPECDLRLHRLLAAFARARASDTTANAAAVEEALIDEVSVITHAGYPLVGRPYLPHLRQAATAADPRADETVATLLSGMGYLLRDQGDYAGARPLFVRALTIREQIFGPTHPGSAQSLNSLAGLLRSQGDYDGARLLFARVLAIREQVFGPTHPATAQSLNNLARLLHDQGDYTAARPLYERALAIREQALGPTHSDTTRSLNNLASLLQAQGELAAAQPLAERALSIREQTLGPTHPDTAISLARLARLLQTLGHFATARPLLERALAITEHALGPIHPQTAKRLDNLALLLQAQGDYAAARPLYERVIAIRDQTLGSDHPDTRSAYDNLIGLIAKTEGASGADR